MRNTSGRVEDVGETIEIVGGGQNSRTPPFKASWYFRPLLRRACRSVFRTWLSDSHVIWHGMTVRGVSRCGVPSLDLRLTLRPPSPSHRSAWWRTTPPRLGPPISRRSSPRACIHSVRSKHKTEIWSLNPWYECHSKDSTAEYGQRDEGMSNGYDCEAKMITQQWDVCLDIRIQCQLNVSAWVHALSLAIFGFSIGETRMREWGRRSRCTWLRGRRGLRGL